MYTTEQEARDHLAIITDTTHAYMVRPVPVPQDIAHCLGLVPVTGDIIWAVIQSKKIAGSNAGS